MSAGVLDGAGVAGQTAAACDEDLRDACELAVAAMDEVGRLQASAAAIVALGDLAARGARLVAVDGAPHVLVDAGRWERMRRAMLDASARLAVGAGPEGAAGES